MNRRRERCTLIIVRRMLTEPKTALAGVELETSFARFVTSMIAFSKERVLSSRFGRWDFGFMVENRGFCERTVWAVRMGGHFAVICLVQTEPFDDKRIVFGG